MSAKASAGSRGEDARKKSATLQDELKMPDAMTRANFGHRLIDGFTMFVVTFASLILLLYVSYGDSKRTYEQIHIEKITTNGRLVQNSIEKFLRDGLPLKQYAGFNTIAGPVLEGEDVDSLAVYDQAGQEIFSAVDKGRPELSDPPAAIARVNQDVKVEYGDKHYHVIIPLRTRFETVGSLVVSSNTKVVSKRLQSTFYPLIYLAFVLSVIFAIVFLFALPNLNRTRKPWLQIGYAGTFLIMSVTVIFTIVDLYYDGVHGKSRASVVTLAQRLSDIVEFNLHFNDLDGMTRIFSEYKRFNSEISEAALVENGSIQINTDSSKVGKKWVPDPAYFEFKIDLTREDQQQRNIQLIVTVPRDVVIGRVVRSAKNLAALFVASALLAGLFLQVAASLQNLRSDVVEDANLRQSKEDVALVAVKPIFFLAVFLDSLTYSFLPNFMQDAARAADVSLGYASVPFTVYYLCFALSLLPAGNLVSRYGPRFVIVLGMLLAAVSVVVMIAPMGIVELSAARGFAGIGQGMLMIGVQAHILAVSSPQKKTQGVAIIVFGFQGGLIAGMALGSLLVSHVQPEGVFAISGIIGVFAIFYSFMRLPIVAIQAPIKSGLRGALHDLRNDIRNVIGNLEFVKTLLCIGIPAKATLTGLITFALPLLLVQYNYAVEDVGQIILLYGLAVMVSTVFASRLVDSAYNSNQVLFWGALLGGAGLILIGFIGPSYLGVGKLGTSVMIVGTILVGIAHGFVNAPIVTHVGDSELGKRIGAISVTTSYRFLERAGHIAGPIFVAQLFLLFGQDAKIIVWIGIAVACLGLLFMMSNVRSQDQPLQAEVTR